MDIQQTDLLLNWRSMTSYPGWAYVPVDLNLLASGLTGLL